VSRLTERIASVEQQARMIEQSRPSSQAQQQRDRECMAAKYGMSVDAAVAKHGTFGAFCCWVMMQADDDTPKPPDNGLSPMEQYRRLING
jgi:hypothetical protein